MKLLRDRDGRPLVLHRPSGPDRGLVSGVTILKPEESHGMTKAEKDGIYTLDGQRFFIAAGDELPAGAVLDGDASTDEAEERAKGAAPENKAKRAAPENRSA